MSRLPAVAVALAAGLLAGCGGGSDPVATTQAAAGRFSGTNGAGIGAAVDLRGFDATTLAVQRARVSRGAPAQTVGIVSLVNRTRSLTEIPVLTAILAGGVRVPMRYPTEIERGGQVRPMPAPGPYIPVQGALTVYVTLDRPADAITGVEMQLPGGDPVALKAEPAPDR